MPSLPILELSGESFELNVENINSVLNQALNLPIVVLSINGKIREGKSYLLNFFIRYLRNNGGAGWFEADLPEEQMFSWSSGSDGVTQGIQIWSEPFHCSVGGRRVAVILLDCQGLFDEHTTRQQNHAIFALSCLLSSVMIYNVMKKVEDDLLEKIDTFSAYVRDVSIIRRRGSRDGRLSFLFLLRDFEFVNEFDFGFHNRQEQPEPPSREGFGNYYGRVFTQTPEMTDENRNIRQTIEDCYQNIGMYLLPHPGIDFVEDSNNNQPRDVFRTKLEELVVHVMRRLVTKRVGGLEVTGSQLKNYVQDLAAICQNGEFPDSPSIRQITSRLENREAVVTALNCFTQKFERFFNTENGRAGVTDENFCLRYQPALDEAIRNFHIRRSSEQGTSYQSYLEDLEAQCLSHFNNHCFPLNQSRRKQRLWKNTAIGVGAAAATVAIGYGGYRIATNPAARRAVERGIETVREVFQAVPAQRGTAIVREVAEAVPARNPLTEIVATPASTLVNDAMNSMQLSALITGVSLASELYNHFNGRG